MNLDHEGLVDIFNHTDALFYNKTSGEAIYTLAQNPPGTLRGVQDFIASTGWTSVGPMILQPDAILTGLLSYNSATGRAVFSTGASPPGTQVIVQDFTAPRGGPPSSR